MTEETMRKIDSAFVKDIGTLIDRCKKNGIKAFQFGPLQFSFHGGQIEERTPRKSAISIPKPIRVPERVTKAQEKIEEQIFTEIEEIEKADSLDDMMLTDPLEYEKNIINGEFAVRCYVDAH